jgi:hypothetical protein
MCWRGRWSSPSAPRPGPAARARWSACQLACPTPSGSPAGHPRFMMLTMGAPSVEFLRQVGQVYATGPTLERLVEVASRHGVKPAFDLPDS